MKSVAVLIVLAAMGLAGCGQSPSPPAESETAVTDQKAPADGAAVAQAVAAQRARFDAAPAVEASPSAYQFEFEGLSTPRVPFTAFKGEVVLVVNTASKCGYTPQYAGLQQIFEDYQAQGFTVLGVPSGNFGGQELATAEAIQDFCALNFGVTFPMAAKSDVIGPTAHSFYKWARSELGEGATPQWNFHKILIGRDGRPVAAFPSSVAPTSETMRTAITQALAA
jgi:glutathione peroxidase